MTDPISDLQALYERGQHYDLAEREFKGAVWHRWPEVVAEVERLRLAIADAARFLDQRERDGLDFPYDSRPLRRLKALSVPESSLSESDLMDLLGKLISGEGGRRTGELKRRGWLKWEVTDAARQALSQQEPIE